MERAYAGTIDDDLGDNNDGAVEIATWRGRGAMTAASFVAVGNDDEPVSASLVTAGSNGSAWISYVITNPAGRAADWARPSPPPWPHSPTRPW